MYRYFFFPDHCIKQIHSILLWVCSTIDHRRRENVVKTTTSRRRVCHVSVFTTFWRQLWSITEPTLGNMESICWIAITAIDVCDDESWDRIHLFVKFPKVSILTEKKFERSNRNFVLMTRILDRNFVSSLEKWVATIYHLACEISPTLEQLMHQNFTAFRRISAKFVFCDSKNWKRQKYFKNTSGSLKVASIFQVLRSMRSSRVSLHTSFVLSPLPACFTRNRAQSRRLSLLIMVRDENGLVTDTILRSFSSAQMIFKPSKN